VPAPAQVGLNPAQFAQFMAAQQAAAAAPAAGAPAAAARPPQGGFKKIANFASGTPVGWFSWLTRFRMAIAINGWDHARARRELVSGMDEPAQLLVGHIPPGDVPDAAGNVPHVDLLIAQFQAVFVPEAAINIAREDFWEAKQKREESISEFHGRVRYLFRQAHPHAPPDAINNNRDAKEIFIAGLRDLRVSEITMYQNPGNFDEALTAANNNTAFSRVMQRRNPYYKKPYMGAIGATSEATAVAGPREAPFLAGVRGGTVPRRPRGAGSGPGPRCYNCQRFGHIRRECPHQEPRAEATGFRPRGRGAGRGGRGRGRPSGRGRPGAASRLQRIAALTSLCQQEGLEVPDWEDGGPDEDEQPHGGDDEAAAGNE